MFDSLPENDGFWNRRRFLKAAGAVAAGPRSRGGGRAGANPDALALNGVRRRDRAAEETIAGAEMAAICGG